ncbi:MAG: diacylglycerol/lipid kinase family protein [Rhodobacterales bacterium]
MNILILHNPKAGDGRLSGKEIVRLFRKNSHKVVYKNTKKTKITRKDAKEADIIVVAGGDGTVGKVIRALNGLVRPLLIVPLGTANNIARALGLPMDPALIAQQFARWDTRMLDLGVVTGSFGLRLFIEGVGIGAIADLVATGDARDMETDEEKRFGEDAPGDIVQRAQPQRWHAVADGKSLPDDLLLLEVLNMPLVGPSLPLANSGAPDDGLLDVAFLRPDHRESFVRWLDSDRSTLPQGLEVLHAREVSFDWQTGPLLVDDHLPDPPAARSRINVQLVAKHLPLLSPPNASAPTEGD